MEIIIRDYEDSDYQRVIGLWKEVGTYYPEYDKRALLRRKIEEDPGSIVVAEQFERIVGTVAISGCPWMMTAFRLAVSRNNEGKGLGRKLMGQAEELARKRGAESIGVYVEPEGPKRFYEGMGYRFVGNYGCLENDV